MNVTAKLVRLHRVELNIRGLTGRLESAQRYLDAQESRIRELDASIESVGAQLRQLEAKASNEESSARDVETRIAALREKMNQATSNKEYSAFLTEINTLKADKSLIEEKALEQMTKVDELREQLNALRAQRDEREKVRVIARTQRDEREAEIRDRLEELKTERDREAGEVPAEALSTFEARVAAGEPDVMAPLEEHDRKRMEYACGSCQVLLPIEKLNGLLGHGRLTTCSACGAILYLEDAVREAATPASRK